MAQSLASGPQAHLDLTGERNRRASAEHRNIDRDFPKCANVRCQSVCRNSFDTNSDY